MNSYQLCEIGFTQKSKIFLVGFICIHSTNLFLGAEIFTLFLSVYLYIFKLNTAKALEFGKPLIAFESF